MKIPLPHKHPKHDIDWQPILNQMHQEDGKRVPVYPGDLKAALLHHAGMTHHPKGEATFQLAREIARLTTCCDPEITYWFARLVELVGHLSCKWPLCFAQFSIIRASSPFKNGDVHTK